MSTGSAISPGERWFAVYTKPHKEYLVRDVLTGRDVRVYLPEVRVSAPRNGRRMRRPFFPHYLFVQLDPATSMMAHLQYTPGVRRVVSAGGRPVVVPDEIVATIRKRLERMEAIRPEERFKEGDVVRVVRGPFEGLDAVFDRRLSPEGRVRVFLQLMSRLVATDLDLDDLELSR